MTKLSNSPLVRRLRRQLPFPIMTRPPAGFTKRQRAEHEAAHIVVALALGGSPLFVHLGDTIGGEPCGTGEAMFGVYAIGDAMGPISVAGMVWDHRDAIGPSDGEILYNWLSFYLGPWPSRYTAIRAHHVEMARSTAEDILEDNRGAVSEVADLFADRDSVFDGRTLCKIARKHMPSRRNTPDFTTYWGRAIGGDEEATAPIVAIGLGNMLSLVRKELACQRSRS